MEGGLFPHGLLHHLVDVGVALVGDDALRVVVQLLLAVPDVLLQVLFQGGVQLHLVQHLLVPLEHLDGVPPQVAGVHLSGDGLLDVGNGVLYAAGEHVGQLLLRLALGPLGGLYAALGGLHAALVFQGAHLHHVAAQGLSQLFQVDFVPVFAHQVNHVHGNHYGDAQLDKLGGQVQVALDVGAVHNV